MELGELGTRNIKEVITSHPQLAEILEKHGIGCPACSIGTCQLREVVSVHFLGAETEAEIEAEIKAYLSGNRQESQDRGSSA